MKNITKKFAMMAATLALVVVLGIALAACGSANDNNAGNDGNGGNNNTTYAELSMDAYLANLAGQGYEVQTLLDTEEKILGYFDDDDEDVYYFAAKDLEWYISLYKVTGESDDDYESVVVMKLKDEATAKSVINKAQEQLEEYKKMMQEYFDQATEGLEEDSEEYQNILKSYNEQLAMFENLKIVRAGNVVIQGSSQASIDAAYTTAA